MGSEVVEKTKIYKIELIRGENKEEKR